MTTINKNHFFTIITASFNNEPTIKQTIESIRNQTFKNLEHIIIDGGSEDATIDILKAAENTYNLTWISERDEGIADALNKGIQQSTGCYILVIQADDRLLENTTLETIYPMVECEEYDMHRFPVLYENPRGKRQIGRLVGLLWWNRFRNIFSHQGVLVHRRVFEQIGNFNTAYSISMDYDFFYRFLKAGCTVKSTNYPIAIVGTRGISSRCSHLSTRLLEEIRVQKRHETVIGWRIAQRIFWALYFPYKTRLKAGKKPFCHKPRHQT